MKAASGPGPRLVLVKHAQPLLDPSRPPREWVLDRAGEEQAGRLADMLRKYLPFHLVSSREPKARRTGEIVADKLGVATAAVEELRELDRPALPILSQHDHEVFNARLFGESDRAVIGTESASSALDRFKRALSELLDRTPPQNVVVITHGTVIALLVANANPDVDAFTLWKRLQCASFVVLDRASFGVHEVVDTAEVENMKPLTVNPIGVVRSPFTSTSEIPKGLGAKHEMEGTIEIRPELEKGLADIEGFSHLYVIWIFDRSEGSDLVAWPPSDTRPHGVFATRSPERPNPIGLTVVEVLGRDGPTLRIRGVDMLDGTPVVDLKPYLSSIPDDRLRRGWLDEIERRR